MADDVDRANDRADHDLQCSIDKARQVKPAALPTGECLQCGEALSIAGARWCDADCRDDWEAER